MDEYNDNLIYSIVIYLIICYILYSSKNKYMFDNNGKFKQFGLKQHETIFPFWLVSLVLGISVYYIKVLRD